MIAAAPPEAHLPPRTATASCAATIGGTQTTYTYNGDGLRQTRSSGGNAASYVSDVAGGLPMLLQDGTNTYVFGLGLISVTDGSGSQTYPLKDGLGSTVALADASGSVTGTYTYDVFGAVRSQSGASTEFSFTGEQNDPNGFEYLRARSYDPVIGRFVSQETIEATGFDPPSAHKYVYALNNPTNLTDSSGQSICAFKAVKTIVKVGAQAVTFVATEVEHGVEAVADLVTDIVDSPETERKLPVLIVEYNVMPDIAAHIAMAQASGQPSILHREMNPAEIATNRSEACGGFVGNGSCDEYPFASTIEGGSGASVAPVPLAQEFIQGGLLGAFYVANNVQQGDAFLVVVINLPEGIP